MNEAPGTMAMQIYGIATRSRGRNTLCCLLAAAMFTAFAANTSLAQPPHHHAKATASGDHSGVSEHFEVKTNSKSPSSPSGADERGSGAGPTGETGGRPGSTATGSEIQSEEGQPDGRKTVDGGLRGRNGNQPLAPNSTNDHGTRVKATASNVNHGLDAADHHGSSRAINSPSSQLQLDAAIGEHQGRNLKKPNGPLTKGITKVNQPWLSRLHRQPLGATANGWPARNAIGLTVDNGASTKTPDPVPHDLPGNTFSGPQSNMANAGPNAVDHPRLAPTAAGGTASSSAVFKPPSLNPSSVGEAGITGTGVIHIGSGPGSIGGRAKNIASINGTGYRPR